MAQATKIEYLDYSWNPIAMRCDPVSEGCAHCWHLAMAHRHAANPALSPEIREARGGGKPVLIEKTLNAPLRMKKPLTIGLQFMGDLFHEDVPFEFIDRVFAVMARAYWHRFMLLTKRPQRMAKFGVATFNKDWGALPNVFLGVTAENQARADERIPVLLSIPAAHHWVSVEPMLGLLDISPWLRKFPNCKSVSRDGDCVRRDYLFEQLQSCPANCESKNSGNGWLSLVVAGGETGPGARPMNPDWPRSLRDQCAAGTPFHFKHWGEWLHESQWRDELSDENRDYRLSDEWPDSTHSFRVGKKRAGRLLDGREWNGELTK